MNERRENKLRDVANMRQGNLTVILENVHDLHNIGAVIRSCDAVGINEIFLLYTEYEHQPNKLIIGKRTSMGTRKWVKSHFYTDRIACFEHVKSKYGCIFATHLATDSISLHEMNMTQSIALLFGNEAKGITKETLEYANGNFIIPQMGMAESLNISVACAVSLYEAQRQRILKNMYLENHTTTLEQKEALFMDYVDRSDNKVNPKFVHRIN